MKLNATFINPSRNIVVFLYKKGDGIVPNHASVYGSTHKKFYAKENYSLEAYFDMTRSEVKALDKPSHRCDSSNDGQSVSKCVGHFIEQNLNCTMRYLMSNSTQETCNPENLSNQHYHDIKEIMDKIHGQEDKEIFEMTGCMPGCSKSTFELIQSKFKDDVANDGLEVTLKFIYLHGNYEIAEDYYLYDVDSFIPDVGGYLGLLLGYNLLSMYERFTQWFFPSKCRMQSSTKKLKQYLAK